MSVLLITHALNNRTKDYSSFYAAIKNNSTNWWHHFEATWIVAAPCTAHQFTQLLYPHMETTDRLLVVKITNDHQGWLPKEAWDWLNQRNYF